MATLAVRKVSDLDADKARFKLQGMKFNAYTNTSTPYDWKFNEDRWVSGGILLAQGTHWGDSISLQIIDKDNILGLGNNAVLAEYVTDFYLITDSEFQLHLDCPYIALVLKNLYLRIIYHNISIVDSVEVVFNIISHIPIT